MKKLIVNFLLFMILLAGMLFAAIGLAGKYAPSTLGRNIQNKRGAVGHMFTRLKEIHSYGPVDILVIGSSHAYRGFDPRVFSRQGYRLFNLGSSAQTPIQTEYLVKKYIDQLRPRLVIFELFPAVFCIDGVESSIDLLSNGEVDWGAVKMSWALQNLVTWNTLVYQLFNSLFYHDPYEEPLCKNGDCYVSGGFVEKQEHYVYQNSPRPSGLTWKLRSDQISAFRRIIAFLKTKKYPVVLVQAPITHNFYNAYENNPEVDQFLRTSGLHYFNVNLTKIGYNNTFFNDADHLNSQGVRVLNQFILDAFSAEELLPSIGDGTFPDSVK